MSTELDILLIYPALSVKERYGNRDVGIDEGHLPPLGLLTIAAYIRAHGYTVDVIDALVLGWSTDDIIRYIKEKEPKLIGFSAITPIFNRARDCAQKVKAAFPEIITVLGGHHATIFPDEILKNHTCFDYIVHGEGELTFYDFMNAFKAHAYNARSFGNDHIRLRAIKGLAFREGENITINPPREMISDADTLPFPARDLVPITDYIPLPNQYKRLPVVHMVVIRGCVYHCTFCSNNTVFGKKIRARSPEKVVEEIEHLIEAYGAKDISFWDDMMTINKKWMYRLCDLIIEKDLDITWTCYARADSVTQEMLQKMATAGCWNIFFGFESGDQQLLDNIEKGLTLDNVRDATRWCKEAGIEIRASFMLAMPGETPLLAQKTIDFAKELNPEYAQFCLTTPYPGTKLFDTAPAWGRLTKDYSHYSIWEPVFIPFGYKNAEEILAVQRRANMQFYLRPRQITTLLKNIRSWEDIKRYCKGFRLLLGFLKN